MDIFPLALSVCLQTTATVSIAEITEALALLADETIVTFLSSDHSTLNQKTQLLHDAAVSNEVITMLIVSSKMLKYYGLSLALWQQYLIGCFYEREGKPFVRVTLAQPVSPTFQAEMEKEISKKMFPQAQNCYFLYQYNPLLIGGAIIHHGDQSWDISVLGKFTQLKSQFITV